MCLKPGIKFPCGCLLGGIGPEGIERARLVDRLPTTRFCRLKDEEKHSLYCVTDTSITLLFPQRCLLCDIKFERDWHEAKTKAKRVVVDVVTRETGPHATGGFSPIDMLQFYREVTAEVEQKVQDLWKEFRDEKAKILGAWWDKVSLLEADPKEAKSITSSPTKSTTSRTPTPPRLKLELPVMDYDKHWAELERTLDDFVIMFDL